MSFTAAQDRTSERVQLKRRPSNLLSKIPKHKTTNDKKWLEELEDRDDSDSDISTSGTFMSRGAFLVTTAYDLPMERVALICERINFKGSFSLTKTATGILFKFSNADDYQTLLKMGFHKVTGARFYRKIPIPCRPRKTFTLYVLDIPDELPVEDIRHAMFKYTSVMEVVRLHIYKANQTQAQTQAQSQQLLEKSMESLVSAAGTGPSVKYDPNEQFERAEQRETPPAVVRITLASFDEYNDLLQNGFNFYDATFFPTEANLSMKGVKVDLKQGIMDGDAASLGHNLPPSFDLPKSYSKLPTLPTGGGTGGVASGVSKQMKSSPSISSRS